MFHCPLLLFRNVKRRVKVHIEYKMSIKFYSCPFESLVRVEVTIAM